MLKALGEYACNQIQFRLWFVRTGISYRVTLWAFDTLPPMLWSREDRCRGYRFLYRWPEYVAWVRRNDGTRFPETEDDHWCLFNKEA